MPLEAFEHLFFNVFDVSELTPTSHIRVFRCSFNLHDKFFYQCQLVPVLFPEMLFANVRRLFLPVLRSDSHGRANQAVIEMLERITARNRLSSRGGSIILNPVRLSR